MNYNFNMNKKYMNKLEAKIKELEEENKVLKELNVCVGCEDNPTYKARIDKAIEYIENNFIDYESAKRDLRLKVSFCVEVGSDELGELLDILKGEKNE